MDRDLTEYVIDCHFEGISLFDLIEQAEDAGDTETADALVALLPVEAVSDVAADDADVSF